jgi:hypothetical protein
LERCTLPVETVRTAVDPVVTVPREDKVRGASSALREVTAVDPAVTAAREDATTREDASRARPSTPPPTPTLSPPWDSKEALAASVPCYSALGRTTHLSLLLTAVILPG